MFDYNRKNDNRVIEIGGAYSGSKMPGVRVLSFEPTTVEDLYSTVVLHVMPMSSSRFEDCPLLGHFSVFTVEQAIRSSIIYIYIFMRKTFCLHIKEAGLDLRLGSGDPILH